MKVSGFTFVRNAMIYDYPIVESIQSLLPLCDEVVVLVGKSDDDTLELVKSIPSERLKVYESVWDDSLREGGRVLAVETDKALALVAKDSEWAIYLQADEVLHENDYLTIRTALKRYSTIGSIDGLLFDYLHFYGSFDYVGDSYRWYRREIRVVKPGRKIYSYRDAQGFRIGDNRKLAVAYVPATVYHYGWVRDPRKMKSKLFTFEALYGSRQVNPDTLDVPFNYSKIDALKKFEGSHPDTMRARVASMNWKFSYDPTAYHLTFRDRVKRFFERLIGWTPGEYRNYRIAERMNQQNE